MSVWVPCLYGIHTQLDKISFVYCLVLATRAKLFLLLLSRAKGSGDKKKRQGDGDKQLFFFSKFEINIFIQLCNQNGCVCGSKLRPIVVW